MTDELGRLERVDLRDRWQDEARDFTPWLAEDDNLKLLADTIGIGLDLEEQEKSVGPFRADILCKNIDDESWVLIENQLERTDHRHLGQILTYAAGLQAVSIVWVASHFTEEHRATLDWLNEHTDDDLRFFGLEVELWRIGDSRTAPKFNIVCKPNNWSRTTHRIAQGELSTTGKLRLNYWKHLSDSLESKSELKLQNPGSKRFQNFPLGRSGFWLRAIILIRDKKIRVEIYLRGKQSKNLFYQLMQNKEQIEKKLGLSLDWEELATKKASRIGVDAEADINDKTDWARQNEWFKKNLEAFDRVFRPRVNNLEIPDDTAPDDWDDEEDDD